MRARDVVDLLLLATVWGGSFLLVRAANPAFGPVALIELRVAIAFLTLLPVLALRRPPRAARAHALPLVVVGITNSAAPFLLYAYALQTVSAGFAAIVNSTAPMFTAVIGYLWLRERLTRGQVAGLVIGVAGVTILVWDEVSFAAGGAGPAVLAALTASALYGLSANYVKRRLLGVPALTMATASLGAAAVLLLPPALAFWPQAPAGVAAWAQVFLLAAVCTGAAYVLYFRLLARVGPARAITVTFLVPVTGTLWGVALLGERVTANMLAGGAVILVGTALVTGVVAWPRKASGAAGAPPAP